LNFAGRRISRCIIEREIISPKGGAALMEKKKIRMACTVGTSAQGHFSLGTETGGSEKTKKELAAEFIGYGSGRGKNRDKKRTFLSAYLKSPEDMKTWEVVRCAGTSPKPGVLSERKFPSAEIQSIVRWLWKKADGSQVDMEIILFENSAEGEGTEFSPFTARVTEFFLYEMERAGLLPKGTSLSIDIKPLVIDVSNEQKFLKSLGGLFEALNDERKKALENGQEFIVNTSGGYKSVSAYAMLYAQLREAPSLYTFEGGNCDAVELTSFPVSYALGALDEEMSLLKALRKSPDLLKSTSRESKNLPLWVRSLVFAGSEGPEMPLVDVLLEEYREKRRGSEAVGSGLLEILGRKGRRYKEYISDRIRNEWAELWIGDQIPETVEHSRRHSKRLMEFAANLYRSAWEPLDRLGLTSPEIIALLISCIYLHDIGHTAISFPVAEVTDSPFLLGSFPSSVREVHHLLSSELIRKKETELFPPHHGLELTFLKKLVPLISAHHRGYTTLTEKQGDAAPGGKIRLVGTFLFGEETFRSTLRPLETKLRELSENERGGIPVETLLDLAALFRIIDGADVQADRVVDDIYLKARLQRTKEEARTFSAELSGFSALAGENSALGEILKKVGDITNAGEKIRIEDILRGSIPKSESSVIKNNCDSVYEDVFNELLHMKAGARCPGKAVHLNRLQALFLSLANRTAFKWEQFLHFFKHQCVGTVFPVYENGEVMIHVWPNSDLPFDSEILGTSLSVVKGDIEKEWEKACFAGKEEPILLKGIRFSVQLHLEEE